MDIPPSGIVKVIVDELTINKHLYSILFGYQIYISLFKVEYTFYKAGTNGFQKMFSIMILYFTSDLTIYI